MKVALPLLESPLQNRWVYFQIDELHRCAIIAPQDGSDSWP
jgi:hypothetical protein